MPRSKPIRKTQVAPITSLDGRRLPKDLLTPIPPSLNVLATSQPFPVWRDEQERRKLELVIKHIGWREHFRDKENKYRLSYLAILNELLPAFPLTILKRAKSADMEESRLFREALLQLARRYIPGFSLGWHAEVSGPGRHKVWTKAQRVDLVHALHEMSLTSPHLTIQAWCSTLSNRALLTFPGQQPGGRRMANIFSEISIDELEGWKKTERLPDFKWEAILWAIKLKQDRQKPSRKT